jgi:hypothetical protein
MRTKHKHTHTYIHTYIHRYIHTYVHTYIRTYIRANAQTGTHEDCTQFAELSSRNTHMHGRAHSGGGTDLPLEHVLSKARSHGGPAARVRGNEPA